MPVQRALWLMGGLTSAIFVGCAFTEATTADVPGESTAPSASEVTAVTIVMVDIDTFMHFVNDREIVQKGDAPAAGGVATAAQAARGSSGRTAVIPDFDYYGTFSEPHLLMRRLWERMPHRGLERNESVFVLAHNRGVTNESRYHVMLSRSHTGVVNLLRHERKQLGAAGVMLMSPEMARYPEPLHKWLATEEIPFFDAGSLATDLEGLWLKPDQPLIQHVAFIWTPVGLSDVPRPYARLIRALARVNGPAEPQSIETLWQLVAHELSP